MVIGNPVHPEVEGIKGWAGEDAAVISYGRGSRASDGCQMRQEGMCCVHRRHLITINSKILVEIISKRRYDISVLNTICSATKERQD